MSGSLLATPYPSADQWRKLVEQFDPKAIALKFLLSHIPYIFRDEPLKYALFRQTIADAFNISPTNVFIVGSAMAGRSLKGAKIDQEYSLKSDIDTLIVSEELFTTYTMEPLKWVSEVTTPTFEKGKKPIPPEISPDVAMYIRNLAHSACKGIWRPDSLPYDAEARLDFFQKFSDVSLKTLGLQLSDDIVAKVTGRIARSFDDAVSDLASNIYRLRKEFRGEPVPPEPDPAEPEVSELEQSAVQS